MRVLVTRPADDSLRTAEMLAKHGHEPVVAPLIEIRWTQHTPLSFHDVQGIVATSANAVRALARENAPRDLPLYAVGDHTAAIARRAGFASVTSAGGDVNALAACISATVDPRAPLLYATGGDVAGDLAGTLGARGFILRRVVLYEAAAASQLPGPARDALERHTLDAALFFSPRSAQIFVDLVKSANLEETCRRVRACCISAPVAKVLVPLAFAEVRVARHPDLRSVVASLS